MFVMVFIALYALLHVYLYACITGAIPLSAWQKTALGLFLAVMILLPFIARRLERHGRERTARLSAWTGYLWMGSIFIFSAVSAITKACWWLFGAVDRHARFILASAHAPFFVSVVLTGLLVPYAFLERNQIRVEKVQLSTGKTLGDDNILRVAQISDVHIGLMSGRRRVRRVIDALARCQPDVIVSTGDLVETHLKAREEIAREFMRLTPRLGKFAVLGNHECYAGLATSVHFIEQCGFVLLRNRSVRAGSLSIAGLDDPAAGWKADDEHALLADPSAQFTLLLKHRPEVLPESADRIDLQLSGHTHKGQIFPFSLLTRMRYPEHAGLFRVGAAFLYVSRGTGSWGPPLRLFASPEITLIEIRTAPIASEAEPAPNRC
ncbi:MAG: metallophosphoesterase [Acidiferrobacteraceae bacterium]